MNLREKKISTEYFSFWKLQNKLTLGALVAILFLSALFVIGSLALPAISTIQIVAFIVMIPALACFGIATCHLSNLESAKTQKEYEKLLARLSETEDSQITLDRFFSIASDLMAVAGKDGHLKKVSKSLVNTLGYSEATLLSTPFFDLIHPDDKEATRENIKTLNLGVRTVGFENRYRAADGSYRTLSWSAAADTELGVRFASARDVTDERNFRIRIQQILDASPFMLVVKDINGMITSCNAAFASSVGVRRDLLIGQNSRNFIAPESVTAVLEKEQEVQKNLNPINFEEVLVIRGMAVRHLSTIFPILDQQGQVISLGKVSLSMASS